MASSVGSHGRVGRPCDLVHDSQTRYSSRNEVDSEQQASGEGEFASIAIAQVPSRQNLCAGCGKPIQPDSKHCPDCSLKNSTESLIAGAQLGRTISRGVLAQARRKQTKRLHDLARNQWSPSSLPAWLTGEVYEKQVQPQLSAASLSQIAVALGVSIPYASDIRKGRRRPHPRHWEALAKLVHPGMTDTPEREQPQHSKAGKIKNYFSALAARKALF